MTQRKQMIGFERFPLPARKTVFQGIAEKNDAFQDERCGFQTKSFKKCQKKFEKGIDRRAGLRYNNRAVSASD